MRHLFVSAALIGAALPAAAQDRLFDATQVLQIGTVDGDPRYTLDAVSDVLRLSDGRIVVSMRHELRYYDSRGRHIRTAGGVGDGPGEFRQIEHMIALTADTVGVYSAPRRTRTIFAPDGSFVRTEPVQVLMGRRDLPIRSVTGDGTLRTARLLPPGQMVGYYGDFEGRSYPTTLQYMMAIGERVVALRDIPATPFATVRVSGQEHTQTVPFGAMPVMTYTHDRVFLGHGSRPELHAFTLTGQPAGTLRLDLQSAPVTRQDVRDLIATALSRMPAESRSQYRQVLEAMEPARTKPYFGTAKGSVDGRIWVAAYDADAAQHRRWWIYRQTGGRLGAVDLPHRFVPYHIAGDYVTGVWRDDDNVEFVRVYRIADTGSMPLARRAGSQHATIPASASTAAIVANVSGSVVVTS